MEAAVIGVPFDTATSMRPGARFGPAGIRDASLLLRPWHPVHPVDVFATLSVVDAGDVEVTPGNAERTAAQIAEQLEPVVRAGVTPLVLGGDHSIVLGELRAHAAVHGPLAVVLLDAHADTWEAYYGERYFHGTPFKRAFEEGLIDPSRSLLAGMRGSLYAAADLDEPRSWGFEIVPCEELRTWTPQQYSERVRARLGAAARGGAGPRVRRGLVGALADRPRPRHHRALGRVRPRLGRALRRPPLRVAVPVHRRRPRRPRPRADRRPPRSGAHGRARMISTSSSRP